MHIRALGALEDKYAENPRNYAGYITLDFSHEVT